MGIVGVKSTAGREVKFIDPSKTTKSESTWLGYTLCESATLFLFDFFLLCTMLNAFQCFNEAAGCVCLQTFVLIRNQIVCF